MTTRDLVGMALEARKNSYAPYSEFKVGAAILSTNGSVYTGCNIENAAYGETLCAEKVAAANAIAAGDKEFAAIAIVGFIDDTPEQDIKYCYPSGSCRQFLSEFAMPDMRVYVAKTQEEVLGTTLSKLFPSSFSWENLELI